MSKNIHTPRDELVCGKLDTVRDVFENQSNVTGCHYVDEIRHDCERMEKKLVSRKDEVAKLTNALNHLVQLKRLKDSEGKTEFYLHQKPIAWEQAERLLK